MFIFLFIFLFVFLFIFFIFAFVFIFIFIFIQVRTEMVVDKGLDPSVADKIGTFVLQSGSPKDLWAILSEKKTFGDHIGKKVK